MDLDNRVDRMDEELKLLKNEIKQVLLEVQEQVLSAQNPFSASIVTSTPPTPASAPATQTPPVTEASEPTPEPTPAPTPAPAPIPQQYQPPPVPQPPAPAPVMPQMAVYAPPSSPPFTPPAAPIPERPRDLPPEVPAPASELTHPTKDDVRHSEPDVRMDDVPRRPGPEFDDVRHSEPDVRMDDVPRRAGPEFKEAKLREPEAAADDFQASQEPSGEAAGIDEVATLSATDHRELDPDSPGRFQEATSERSASAEQSRDEFSPPKDRRRKVVDLVTIAGLAQWTDRALKKAGREYVEELVDVSEQTGRLGPGVKDTLLNLMKLLGDRDEGPTVSAKDMVLMLAQLDSLGGIGPTGDPKLLTILLQDDSEVFPSIRP